MKKTNKSVKNADIYVRLTEHEQQMLVEKSGRCRRGIQCMSGAEFAVACATGRRISLKTTTPDVMPRLQALNKIRGLFVFLGQQADTPELAVLHQQLFRYFSAYAGKKMLEFLEASREPK